MNNQLELLESRINQLIERFNALLSDKHHLQQEVQHLREQQEKQSAQFEEEREQLNKQHELNVFLLEQNLQQTIDALKADKAHYEAAILQSVEQLETVLKRFPAPEPEQAQESAQEEEPHE